MPRKSKEHKDEVVLSAFGDGKQVLEETVCSLNEYYDGSVPLIDDSDHRKMRGILKVKGLIYTDTGNLQSSFENLYDKTGALLASKQIHEDGTTTT